MLHHLCVRRCVLMFFAACLIGLAAGANASVHDTVWTIRERLAQTYPLERLNALTVADIAVTLTDEERRVLGTEHIRFHANVPVRVYVARDRSFSESEPLEPFWIEERDFEKTGFTVQAGARVYDVFARDFDAGTVGLGVNSLSGSHSHYFVMLSPVRAGDALQITNLFPKGQEVTAFQTGVRPFTDPALPGVEALPPELEGLTLLRTNPWRHRDARLTGIYTETRFPASPAPDQVVLTWSDDPKTTQTIQWRTDTSVTSGAVAYTRKSEYTDFALAEKQVVPAQTREVYTPRVVNDPRIHRHTVTLTGLEPDTVYLYAVSDGSADGWADPETFRTAPAEPRSFTFLYLGDAQNGMDQWGQLLARAEREHPEAAFGLIAGDLVNRGNDRDDWDDFFHNAGGYFARRPLVPVLGNHEYNLGRNGPDLYHQLLTLPKNGPDAVPPQHVYYLEYGNTLFIILDSNQPPPAQVPWMDATLGASKAAWTFASFHHPIYSSSPRRDNPIHRATWVPVFDRHNVDMVLQGHDHAYMRTWRMRENRRVEEPDGGTIYVVSVSGTKMYDQRAFEHAAKAMTETSTYQVIDIHLEEGQLRYRAFDASGALKDELTLEE